MNMTNRELLELATKAAGMAIAGLADKMLVDPEHWTGGLIVETRTGGHKAWNPLTDDGDCARLEAELGLCTIWCPTMVRAETINLSHAWTESYADHSGDKQAARRRASVRAAATISNTTSAPDTTTAGAKG